jgi:hypothetical protein
MALIGEERNRAATYKRHRHGKMTLAQNAMLERGLKRAKAHGHIKQVVVKFVLVTHNRHDVFLL